MSPPSGETTNRTNTDPIVTAAYAAVLSQLFPPDRPGKVRTLDDDGSALFVGTSTIARFPSAPGFEITGRIARGRMGDVYRAREVELDRAVALKFVRAGSHADAFRLDYEAKLLGKCPHPNIVQIHRVVPLSETQVFLVMELINGTTLDAWLRTPRRPREILRRMIEVGRALEAAHLVGVIHRDVKPTNIMLDERGQAKLIDFGLADADRDPHEAANTSPSLTVGTYDYIAPEHYAGNVCTSRSDQYSFCVVVHEALYGRKPKRGFDPPSTVPARPFVPRAVRRALLRGLHPDPRRRWPAMEPLLQALATRPWWQRPSSFWIFQAMVVLVLSIGFAGLVQDSRRAERVNNYKECRTSLRDRHLDLQQHAVPREIDVSTVPSSDEDAVCRRAHVDADPEAQAAVVQRRLCIDIHIAALRSYAQRANESPSAANQIKHSWSSLHTAAAMLPACPVNLEVTHRDPQMRRALETLIELRLLLQEQQFVEAHTLLVETALIPNLIALDGGPVLAEALFFAGHLAKRYKQVKQTILIHDMDAEQLLNLAEIHADRTNAALYAAAIRLERIDLALDERDARKARMLLIRADRFDQSRPPELRVLRLRIEARLAAASGDTARSLRLLVRAALEILWHPRLIHTSLPFELLGTASIRMESLDSEWAYRFHDFSVTTARSMLGPRRHLTGVLAANAARHAFRVGYVVDGEQWDLEALAVFARTCGAISRSVQQLEYDLAYNLFTRGESARAVEHAQRSIELARQLDVPAEVTWSLFMKSAIQHRMGDAEASRTTATTAASVPASLRGRADYKYLLDVGLLTIDVEQRFNGVLASRVHALREYLDRPGSPAFLETKLELRVLAAKSLARLGKLDAALDQLRELSYERMAGIEEPFLRADVLLLRSYLYEQADDSTAASGDACHAKRLLDNLGTDGRLRLNSVTQNTRPLLPSIAVFERCPLTDKEQENNPRR